MKTSDHLHELWYCMTILYAQVWQLWSQCGFSHSLPVSLHWQWGSCGWLPDNCCDLQCHQPRWCRHSGSKLFTNTSPNSKKLSLCTCFFILTILSALPCTIHPLKPSQVSERSFYSLQNYRNAFSPVTSRLESLATNLLPLICPGLKLTILHVGSMKMGGA